MYIGKNTKKEISRMVDFRTSFEYIKGVKAIVTDEFERLKEELINAFNGHAVTEEIEGGPKASNTSNTKKHPATYQDSPACVPAEQEGTRSLLYCGQFFARPAALEFPLVAAPWTRRERHLSDPQEQSFASTCEVHCMQSVRCDNK